MCLEDNREVLTQLFKQISRKSAKESVTQSVSILLLCEYLLCSTSSKYTVSKSLVIFLNPRRAVRFEK